MKYQSKKHPEVIASLDFKDEKFKTVMLIYLTGPDAGKSVSITESTFKRWWKKYEEAEQINSDVTVTKEEDAVAPSPTSPLDSLGIDYDKVNEPYPEPKCQKYIKKPESVVAYENKKRNRHNAELPEFEDMTETLMPAISKINKDYVRLKDDSTVWRKTSIINIYAAEDTWEKLTYAGLKSRANVAGKSQIVDKKLPYAFDIRTKEEFDKVVKALLEE